MRRLGSTHRPGLLRNNSPDIVAFFADIAHVEEKVNPESNTILPQTWNFPLYPDSD